MFVLKASLQNHSLGSIFIEKKIIEKRVINLIINKVCKFVIFKTKSMLLKNITDERKNDKNEREIPSYVSRHQKLKKVTKQLTKRSF